MGGRKSGAGSGLGCARSRSLNVKGRRGERRWEVVGVADGRIAGLDDCQASKPVRRSLSVKGR
eukprot:363372-Chlamydomonas_euryale.AAC.3